MNKYAFLLLLITFSLGLCAQNDFDVEPETQPQRVFPLTFSVDIGTHNLGSFQTVSYTGEYRQFDGVLYTQPQWTWRDTSYLHTFNHRTMRSYSLGASLTVWRGLGIGLEYHILLLTDRSQTTIGESVPLFSIAALVDYDYTFNKPRGVFIKPSVSFGTYQSNNFYEGAGREIYTNLKLSAGYRLNNAIGIQLFLGQNLYWYYEESYSDRFRRDQFTNIHVNVLEAGFGVSYRFNIIPD